MAVPTAITYPADHCRSEDRGAEPLPRTSARHRPGVGAADARSAPTRVVETLTEGTTDNKVDRPPAHEERAGNSPAAHPGTSQMVTPRRSLTAINLPPCSQARSSPSPAVGCSNRGYDSSPVRASSSAQLMPELIRSIRSVQVFSSRWIRAAPDSPFLNQVRAMSKAVFEVVSA
jgi:hypothetical protein